MTEGGTVEADALRLLPLRVRHLGAGARMMPFAGWEMPLQYEGIVAEHQAVRSDAGIFDVSHMGRVRLEGSGAGERLRSATTFDVTRIDPGRTHYSLYCTEDGGIADDIVVFRLDADRWLVVHNAANAEEDAERLREAAGEAAEDVGTDTVMLAVQGPRAPEVIRSVLGPTLDGLEARACTEVEWQGARLVLSRTGYTGEDGGEMIAPAELGGDLWDAFVEAGAKPCGLGARDTLRLEAALALHGHDISPETTPYEAGLTWAVTVEDGRDFIGREALERLAGEEPGVRLAWIRLLERGVPREGYTVVDQGGEPVATLTSGAFSPTLRAGIGMAYLPVEVALPGTRLSVEVRDRLLPAEVVPRPFYRRPKQAQRQG
jgi:aminomethyltransferase